MGSDKSDFKNVLEKVGIPTNVLKKRSKNYKRKFVSNKPEPTTSDPGESVYRNRALERSQLKEEYKKVQEEYELFKKQTEEESRYMGGDEEHTHLVKGLDYKLLEKVKRQLETKTSDTTEAKESNEDSQFCFTEFGFYFYKRFFYHTNLNNINFKSKLNQTIDLLSKGYKFKANKILNITYNFNLSNEDLPSIIINDVNTNSSSKLLTNKLELKQELMEVFNWHIENRKKKKSERLPFRPTSTNEQSKEEDSEDDIYQNIDKYRSDELNPEVITSLTENKKYLECLSLQELGSTSISTDTHELGNKQEKEEDSINKRSVKEGREYKITGLTYKIPEKLLKKSKIIPTTVDTTFQSDIDLDDSDEELVQKKRKNKKTETKQWNKIQEIMKEKELSVDDYQVSTSSSKKEPNKGFKVI